MATKAQLEKQIQSLKAEIKLMEENRDVYMKLEKENEKLKETCEGLNRGNATLIKSIVQSTHMLYATSQSN